MPSGDSSSRRWMVLAVVAAAYVLSFFQRFAPAGIAPDLAAAFQTSAASLGVLAATYFYVYTVMQIPTGILVDTLGPRRILLLGGLVGGVGSIVFSMAPTLQAALVGRTLVGLGVSVTFIAMLKIIALSFEEERFATLVGAGLLVGNLGSVLAGAPLSALAQAAGWRGVFLGAGAVSVVLGIACWWLVKDSAGRGEAARPRFDRTVVLGAVAAVLKNRATWPPSLVLTGICGSFFAFGGLWAMPYLTQVHGLARADASARLSVYFASFALGAFFIGTLSDRLGRRKPIMIVATHLYALTWLVWLANVPLAAWASYALFAVMGLTTASFTLSWACAKEVNPPLLSGMSTSVANMGGFLAAAILQPLVGFVMDLGWTGTMANGVRLYGPDDFRWGLALLAGSAWMGAAFAWRIQETNCRNIWQP